MAGKEPDFNVTAMCAGDHDYKGRIGAGWKNDDGSISIRLDAFISLLASDRPMIRLWPAGPKEPSKAPKARSRAFPVQEDDDQPF